MSTQGLRLSGTLTGAAGQRAAGPDRVAVRLLPCQLSQRGLVFSAGVLVLAAGCTGVSPGSDPFSGRLAGAVPSAPQAGDASGVVPASASEPVAAQRGARPTDSASARKSDDDDGFDWSDLSPDNVVKNVKNAAGLGPDEELAHSLFQEGRTLFEQEKYSEAAEKFKSAGKRWPDSLLEEDALFWQGESYFFSDRYPKAQDTYDNLLKKYDNSRHLDTTVKRLFSIGRYWEQLHRAHPDWPVTPNLTDKERPWFDTFGNALKAYETVRMKDPTGPMADDSIMATANAHFGKGRYEDASYHYDLLRTEYPRSEHQLQAHVLGLQSKLRVYQGNLYDGTPLDEADEIAEQTLTQFRDPLGPEQVRVAQTRDRILEQKAERDWAIAQYYDNKKQYGHARIYYQYIIRDYPLAETAHKARARLDQIRNEPDRPPNRFKWLTDVFSAEE